MAIPTLNPLSIPTSSAIADWLELVTFVAERRVMSPAKGREFLEESGSPGNEDDVALAFSTLHERCSRNLGLYPFTFSRLGLERACDVDPTVYQFLLLLASAMNGTVAFDDLATPSVLFERLARIATMTLFGPSSRAVRFGHPPEPERPTSFADAVRWLADKLHARPLPLSGATLRRNDGGVDVVAWREFEDGRSGTVVAAVQVTFESDLRGKSLEIAGNELDRWMAIARPVPVLAVPVDGTDDVDLFAELSARVLTLDRWRLLHCLEGLGGAPVDEWRPWTRTLMAQLEI
jgi:hypothetical protein